MFEFFIAGTYPMPLAMSGRKLPRDNGWTRFSPGGPEADERLFKAEALTFPWWEALGIEHGREC
jgi:hypothetical protein